MHYATFHDVSPAATQWTVVTVFDSPRPASDFRDLYLAGQIFEAPPDVQAGWVYEHVQSRWYPPQASRVITGAEFLGRFTPAELNEAASKAVIGALLVRSTQNTVDLNEQTELLDELVTAAVLSTQRKLEILA